MLAIRLARTGNNIHVQYLSSHLLIHTVGSLIFVGRASSADEGDGLQDYSRHTLL